MILYCVFFFLLYLCPTMKRLQKITSLFLAFSFLLSSLGFTVNKMVCLKSGESKVSLIALKDCCPGEEEEESGCFLSHSCCDITNTYFDLSDFSSASKVSVEEQITVQPLFYNSQISFQIDPVSQTSANLYADLPPPLHGRQLLSFISVLII